MTDESGTGQVETAEVEELNQSGEKKEEAPAPKSATPPPAKKEAPPKAEEVFELKVNGKLQKLSRSEVMNLASMSHVAQSKFDEAAQIRKENERLRELAKKDPMAAFLDPALGVDKSQLRDILEEYYNREYIEPEELTPEQRKTKELEAKIKKYEDDQREIEDKKKKEVESEQETQERNYLQTKIISALENSMLPKTPYYAARMAFYMGKNMENGWEAPEELVIQQVRNEFNSVISQITSQPIEAIVKILPPDFLTLLRQYDLTQLRESRLKKGSGFLSSQNERNQEKQPEKVYGSDVNDRIRKMQREGF